MSTVFDRLLELAELDVELVTLERSRGVLPARVALEGARDTLREIERARALLEPERVPLALALADLEVQVAHLSERKVQLEERLSSSTGAGRELEILHNEARHLGEMLRGLEDQELELMEALEPLESRLAALAQEAEPLEVSAVEMLAALAVEEGALDAALGERQTARAEVAAALEPSLLARYERVARHEHGAGAARLEHGRCSGCHLALASAELDRLRHLAVDELSTCEQCERILVRPDQLSE